MKGDGEFGEEGGWVVDDFHDVGDSSDVNGTLGGEIPLMSASSEVGAYLAESHVAELDDEGSDNGIVGFVEAEFVDEVFCVDSDGEEE